MGGKTFLQLFLILIVIVISFATFYLYFYENKQSKKLSIENDIIDLNSKTNSSNIINDIKYVSKDSQGNVYEIFAQQGSMDDKNKNIIFMTNVRAKIYLNNSGLVNISSKFSEYNNKTNETNFSQNVIVNFLNHTITGENLNLSFENNLVSMSNKIIYKHLGTIVEADRLEIDLLTKDSKIFMEDKTKKIKITN
ncbi:MAG: Lipopolysaccharide-assembly, LptC-related [Pelagibacterales bacterium]|nr:Lipopolysaccharide-assembly, LptC-related [Pelagibacterales bacterium]